jgi:predicted ATPase
MAATERLVGRRDVQRSLAQAWDQARAGAGLLVLVTGEAGIGKSAVLAWLAEQAVVQGRVLRGFCWEGGGVPPYWPWTQVLRATGLSTAELGEAAWLLGAQPSDVDTTADTRLASFAAVTDARLASFAAVTDARLASFAEVADARFRLFDAVARALADLAGPVLVVIDDLHWADEPSLALLSFAARVLASSPVLLLGAYRDAEAGPALHRLAGAAQHLPLAGLSLAEVAAMVAQMPGQAPPPEVTGRVWRRSGGNPFFVRELTRLVQAHGPDQAPARLPAGVVDVVRQRLARLPTDCVRLLDWAAVAGRDIDLNLLIHSGAIENEAAALDLIALARQAGVVTDDLSFTHDIYREAIVDVQSAATNATINLALGRALQARERPGDAARIAAHLLRAGPPARRAAVDYCIRAAREATARLGHDDACGHYLRALSLVDDEALRASVLLELAAAHDRTGMSHLARERYREAARLTRARGDAVALAHAALGLHSLGQRSGATDAEVRDLLRQAALDLAGAGTQLALQSRVQAALARVARHGAGARAGNEMVQTARRAVRLADDAGDPRTLAEAKLALHDVLWSPGTAAQRLPVVGEMLGAAHAAGDADLVAQAHLLRATALIELGDPAGRDELLSYITLAGELGHARGRWGALTRQATYAQIAGRAQDAARFGEEALEIGMAIGEPDAFGCYCTSRWSLVALGVPAPDVTLGDADPLWPMLPVMRAWPLAVRGEIEAAREALGDFSVLEIATSSGYDLEARAVAAVVFAAVGSPEQRRWVYDELRPYAGTHVVIGGCASYHAAVDHHLGALAAALGEREVARGHLRDALAMHERLGAAGWARLTAQALAELDPRVTARDRNEPNEFRRVDGRWLITYAGQHVQLPDAKGLHDLWLILGAKGTPVHVRRLLDPEAAPVLAAGADPVLDDRARTEYRARLARLAHRIEEADDLGHSERAEALRAEREALVHELAAAAGFGRRARRLGDPAERARKTVSARLRDSLAKIERVHPLLGAHLRSAVRMGTACSYAPAEPIPWRLA